MGACVSELDGENSKPTSRVGPDRGRQVPVPDSPGVKELLGFRRESLTEEIFMKVDRSSSHLAAGAKNALPPGFERRALARPPGMEHRGDKPVPHGIEKRFPVTAPTEVPEADGMMSALEPGKVDLLA